MAIFLSTKISPILIEIMKLLLFQDKGLLSVFRVPTIVLCVYSLFCACVSFGFLQGPILETFIRQLFNKKVECLYLAILSSLV